MWEAGTQREEGYPQRQPHIQEGSLLQEKRTQMSPLRPMETGQQQVNQAATPDQKIPERPQ